MTDPNESYNILISNVIVLKESLEIPDGKQIGLGGGRLVGRNGVDTIIVKSGESLMIFSGLVVTHVEGDIGRGVYVEHDGTFVIRDGVVSGNTAARGGGVYNAGYFELHEVYSEDAEVCLISDNTADYGGGVYNVGTFIVDGGRISNNTATANGGGLYNAGTFDKLDMHGSADVVFVSNVALSGEGGDVFEGVDIFVEEYVGNDWWSYLLFIGAVVIVGVIGAILLFYRSKRKSSW